MLKTKVDEFSNPIPKEADERAWRNRMGREIRRVPPNWQHPKKQVWNHRNQLEDRYQPMFDSEYSKACEEWYEGAKSFVPTEFSKYYHEWAGNPPDENYFRSYSDEEATWYQVYETVSEGTPTTPPFETQDQLIEYLCTHKDFWDYGPVSRESAVRFVKEMPWAPSMIVTSDGNVRMGIDAVEVADSGGSK